MHAPDFSLPDQSGSILSLSESAGTWRIVYFYPKDDTPGCTTEACNFRDSMKILKEKGIIVYGISKDGTKSHKKFADKFSLNFPLLSDPTHETIEKYGAWKPKKFMGREYLGIVRKTFLINPDGEIIKEYEGMKLESHAQDILKDINDYTLRV